MPTASRPAAAPSMWAVRSAGMPSAGSSRTTSSARRGRRCQNIVAVLAEAGAEPHHITTMTWYLLDKKDYIAAAGRSAGPMSKPSAATTGHGRGPGRRADRGRGPRRDPGHRRRSGLTERNLFLTGRAGARKHAATCRRGVDETCRPPIACSGRTVLTSSASAAGEPFSSVRLNGAGSPEEERHESILALCRAVRATAAFVQPAAASSPPFRSS